MSSSDGGHTYQSDTDSSVEETDFDTMPDIESDKNIIRTKVPMPGHTLGEDTKLAVEYNFSNASVSLFLFSLQGKSDFPEGFLDKT